VKTKVRLLLFAASLVMSAVSPAVAQGPGGPPNAGGDTDYSAGYQDGYNDAYQDAYRAGYDDAQSGRPFDDTVSGPGYNGPPGGTSPADVSFGSFYDQLAPYGEWYHHPRWGDVWHPLQVGADFRPYVRGHWADANEFGWTWVSDYPWGDIPFHYGRWVFDPYDGWLWVPGYVWSPAWVVWRSGGGTVGWFPMPPDDQFLAGYDVYRTDWNWNRGFGYRDWYGPSFALNSLLTAWVFVDLAHFGDRDYARYVRPQNQYVTIINRTTNVTNYTTVNNHVVNRSIDVSDVERASGRRIQPISANQVFKAPITTVEVGRQIGGRERRDHGGNPNASALERIRPLPTSAIPAPTSPRGARIRDQQTGQPNPQPNIAVPQGRERDRRDRSDLNGPGQQGATVNQGQPAQVESSGSPQLLPGQRNRQRTRDNTNNQARDRRGVTALPPASTPASDTQSDRQQRVQTDGARARTNETQDANTDKTTSQSRRNVREQNRRERGSDEPQRDRSQ
jgi:Family of unknown function (DUF6600)